MTSTYDLAIIGAGSAGLTAADFAIQIGMRVALLDNKHIGGDCTWSGCVPSKTLLKVAKVNHQMNSADRYGLISTNAPVNLKDVMAHVKSVVDDIYKEETPEVLQGKGIDVFIGDVKFVDDRTISVGDKQLTARRILLCTGASPFIPPIDGLSDVDYLTYQSLWDLKELPKHLVVVGGGPIGCEMAQAFCRLGSKVTLVEAGDHLLPRDEPDASHLLAEVLKSEGVDLLLNATVRQVWQNDDGIHLDTGQGEVTGDVLLVAVGRHPNVDGLSLENAGVRCSHRGIEVNKNLRTSNKHIYAAGDCTGGYQFTHYAGWQAAKAVRNAFIPFASKGVLDHVPWTTFTDPEVAHAGLSEAEARQKHGDNIQTYNWFMTKVDRAHTEGDTSGFIKLVCKKSGKLLGVTIVAARAGEMINEWSLALDRGLKFSQLSESIHVYPTYSTANQMAATDIRMSGLMSGLTGKMVRFLGKFT
ncbi:MAG: FAD-dependent oxidoreductase [Chloroflexi bacterium]|jgi:pyruvate/2-oxoglutarate dehydrogenase complex dihydrolipoamide dehydrogenase (E3) component|nr:FAD-dependent oxidoreductase [Chloroflexota bacterium]MBT7080606.1 FAD-dependent oxidoreductase [Chloroflexota bacterium]MBT7289257.1 FAD-dependent oxidoreductase [Chloroflexota bacterium]